MENSYLQGKVLEERSRKHWRLSGERLCERGIASRVNLLIYMCVLHTFISPSGAECRKDKCGQTVQENKHLDLEHLGNLSANEIRIRNVTSPQASPFSSSFTVQPCLTKIPCTTFCLVPLISLFKVPCTPVSSMSYRLCSSLTLSSYTSRQVTVTELQRVKRAALPQWSTTPPPFLHPFIAQLLHSSLQIPPPAEKVWRVQDGASTGELMRGGRLTGRLSQAGRELRTNVVVRATACNGRSKCQPYSYIFE